MLEEVEGAEVLVLLLLLLVVLVLVLVLRVVLVLEEVGLELKEERLEMGVVEVVGVEREDGVSLEGKMTDDFAFGL